MNARNSEKTEDDEREARENNVVRFDIKTSLSSVLKKYQNNSTDLFF